MATKNTACNHDERYITDRVPEECRKIEGHDCAYVDARNALIREAEQIASQKHDQYDSVSWKSWVAEFHTAMNRLAYERGLTKYNPALPVERPSRLN